MKLVRAWLADYDWSFVCAQNLLLCQAKNALHKPTSDGHDTTRDLWQCRHRDPMRMVGIAPPAARAIWGIYLAFRPANRAQPSFPRPPVFATCFAEATKVRKATTGRPVRPNGCFRGFLPKANSWQPPSRPRPRETRLEPVEGIPVSSGQVPVEFSKNPGSRNCSCLSRVVLFDSLANFVIPCQVYFGCMFRLDAGQNLPCQCKSLIRR